MNSPVESFQLSSAAAELYESKFVPAIFAEWAPRTVDAAEPEPGHRILDVACGTGIVAREAARRAGPDGVTGVDINEGMLAVARRLRPDIRWRRADAAHLPFDDCSFDIVLCQAALMFFPDPAAALREMARVLRPDGTIALQVWCGLDDQPGYRPFIHTAARHAGPDAARLLGAYWTLGNPHRLHDLIDSANLRIIAAHTILGTARFQSIDDMVRTEIESTPLVERTDARVHARIAEDSRTALGPFINRDGMAEIPIAGRIVTARHARP